MLRTFHEHLVLKYLSFLIVIVSLRFRLLDHFGQEICYSLSVLVRKFVPFICSVLIKDRYLYHSASAQSLCARILIEFSPQRCKD